MTRSRVTRAVSRRRFVASLATGWRRGMWMRRLMGLWAAMLLTSAVQACPPQPSPAEWTALADAGDEGDDSERQAMYALARLMKCGWLEAKPAFVQLLQRPRAPDDEQEDMAGLL